MIQLSQEDGQTGVVLFKLILVLIQFLRLVVVIFLDGVQALDADGLVKLRIRVLFNLIDDLELFRIVLKAKDVDIAEGVFLDLCEDLLLQMLIDSLLLYLLSYVL